MIIGIQPGWKKRGCESEPDKEEPRKKNNSEVDN